MDYNDWKVNEHSVAVLYPAARVVNDIEGTQYVTASLVLPSVYMLIHKVCKGEIVCNRDDSVVQPQQTTPEVRAARANLRTALEDRFIKALRDHVFEQYSIAKLLDPRLKSFRFLSQGQRDDTELFFSNLSTMARQYLATPATSAGVERLFSAAGLTFGDLAHAMKEETLGCRLLAAYNYTHALYCYP